MTTTTHTRSIDIDAPVAKVFDYVKDPKNIFYAVDQAVSISEENIAPDTGEGSVWDWQSHVLFVPFHGTLTRETYVPQERIVDHSTTGVTYAFTVKPAGAGTTLIMEVGVSSRVPFLDKVEDKVFWKGDRDLDKYLGIYKQAIEA
jgi:uncharacterized protein YndB with AHSA1/START domain